MLLETRAESHAGGLLLRSRAKRKGKKRTLNRLMEPNPITLAVVIPILMGLGLLCMVRRHRQKLEREKEWEKSQKKYRYKDWRY